MKIAKAVFLALSLSIAIPTNSQASERKALGLFETVFGILVLKRSISKELKVNPIGTGIGLILIAHGLYTAISKEKNSESREIQSQKFVGTLTDK